MVFSVQFCERNATTKLHIFPRLITTILHAIKYFFFSQTLEYLFVRICVRLCTRDLIFDIVVILVVSSCFHRNVEVENFVIWCGNTFNFVMFVTRAYQSQEVNFAYRHLF